MLGKETMKGTGFGLFSGALLVSLMLSGFPVMAETNQSDTARWLAKAPIAPPFKAPTTKEAWETRRKEIRGETLALLGRLPARPNNPQVKTLSREDRGDYILEKFQFD